MSFDKKDGYCFCERCGHGWTAKETFQNNRFIFLEPRSCAGCKSKVWNKPRVYSNTKNFSGICFAQREKPTGRQAAKLSPEKIRKEQFEQLKKTWKQAKQEYFRLERQFFEMSKNGEFTRYPEQKRQMDYLLNQASNKIIEAEEAFITSKANLTMTWKEAEEVKEVFNNILYRERNSPVKRFTLLLRKQNA